MIYYDMLSNPKILYTLQEAGAVRLRSQKLRTRGNAEYIGDIVLRNEHDTAKNLNSYLSEIRF